MPDDPTPEPTADDPAPTLSRKELRQQSTKARRGSTAWWWVLGGVGVLVVAGLVALVATSSPKTATVKTQAAPVATTTPAPVATCPLTGTPAPGGTVPARPALGIKIGNYPDDRPSAGLNQADIVFEEPVEGAITRLVAVFQCQGAPLVGDLRSARQPDAGILSQLSNPLFVHAGGIEPVIALMKASALQDEDLYSGNNGSAIIMQPGRVAPYSTFVSTASLWAFAPSDVTPPAPIFQFSASPPAGSVAGSGASVHIPFSSSSDVTWTWSPATGTYLRSYAGTPDTLLSGGQTAAHNVVVLTVQTATGSWVENEEGGHEVLVTSTGSGPVVVLRNGVAIDGTWSRSSLTSPTTFAATDGTPITLEPGNTWEELVPAGITVTTTAAAAPAPASAASTTSTTR
jgi:hypothetical protein